ncbi:hypothetical protein C1646_708815 [Rhizophagus diaphanus]|nr:hypothetical protein C1646_708815 [Rhizophagus diaphanus] [Rhizophagus sp. MUCL 43196]
MIRIYMDILLMNLNGFKKKMINQPLSGTAVYAAAKLYSSFYFYLVQLLFFYLLYKHLLFFFITFIILGLYNY